LRASYDLRRGHNLHLRECAKCKWSGMTLNYQRKKLVMVAKVAKKLKLNTKKKLKLKIKFLRN
jgi:hypothetical protein